MKTKLLFLITMLFLFQLNAQTYILNNEFESDAVGTLPEGWVIRYNGSGAADQKVVDAPVKNGSHSLQVSGTSWAANLHKNVSEMPNYVTLEGWMYAKNVVSGGRCGLAIGNPTTGTWGAFLARVEFYNGNLITFYHTGNSGGYGTQYILQSAEADRWYHAKLEVNRLTATYKVYINGVLASSNTGGSVTTEFPLLTIAAPTSVELYGNSMVYFDDVKLYETKKPVAFYPFNGNANDESGNQLNGTVSGATLVEDRFGNLESAYYFDGNDIITINHDDILNSEEELSISVWIKPDLQQNAMILGKSNYVTATNYLLRTKSTGFLQFEYKNYANSNNLPLTVNEWNHIAVVSLSDDSQQIYVNGSLASHTVDTSPYGIVTNVLTIGARQGAEYFRGSIDDLMIFKSSLSESEVLSLFNNNSLNIQTHNVEKNRIINFQNNVLTFTSSDNYTRLKSLFIYNLTGQIVFESSNLTNTLDLNFLKQGIYIVKAETDNHIREVKKIFVR